MNKKMKKEILTMASLVIAVTTTASCGAPRLLPNLLITTT